MDEQEFKVVDKNRLLAAAAYCMNAIRDIDELSQSPRLSPEARGLVIPKHRTRLLELALEGFDSAAITYGF